MSTTIQIKRSSTASAVPLTGDLEVGELAINLADKRLFTKKSDGTIVELSTNPTDIDIATLRIDGVEVTASAAELNSLDGSTASTADLNKLAAITSTATELNKLDGFTGSTAELNILDGVTATTAEINVLDGITATTAELNVLDGVTSTTAEINKLDGFTGTVADLNYAKDLRATGVTTAELDVLDGITATTAELNITDGLTATTAELNTLDGITATTTELNYTDGVTSNIQTQLNAMVEKAGDTMTGDLSLGDNVKAKFGAGDDLQIYSDGTNSIIKESGAGSLNYEATNINFKDATGTDFTARFITGGDVRLYHDGNQKLATTSTGVDVTGTITADGLTVDGEANIGGSGTQVRIQSTPATGILELGGTTQDIIRSSTASEGLYLQTGGSNKRLVVGSNGDVSFYEDTGTTAKMVWDASAESLGVGTSSPESYIAYGYGGTIEASGGRGGHFVVSTGDKSSKTAFSHYTDTGDGILKTLGNNKLHFSTNDAAPQVTLDTTGNVGIGTASPDSLLEIVGADPILTIRDSETSGGLTSATLRLAESGASDTLNKYWDISHAGNQALTFNYDAGGERARIDSSGNVGIGTASPSAKLHVNTTATAGRQNLDNISKTSSNLIRVTNPQYATDASVGMVFRVFPDTDARQGAGIIANGGGSNNSTDISLFVTDASAVSYAPYRVAGQDGTHTFYTAPSQERARIDSSGNLLVGKTSASSGIVGVEARATGRLFATADGAYAAKFERLSSDGTLIQLTKDGSTDGSIGVYDGRPYLASTTVGIRVSNALFPSDTSGAVTDGAMNIGGTTGRFKDLYLSGGVYLGGTGAANKLDDYEEGVWTPVLKSSGNATMTLLSANGYYTKVGNKVTGWFECEASVDLTDPNYYTIEGIPFSINTNHANSKHIGSANSAQNTISRGLMHSVQYINSAALRVFVHSDGTTNKNFDYSDAIYGTFTYFVA